MDKLVTIYGGAGFIGRYIAQRMARLGWQVRVAVRRPNEALFVKTYGAVGQVEPVLCNVRDAASVASALAGADAVVNCVGILVPRGPNGFDAVQVGGAENIARAAAAAGIDRLVHISAIGACAHSNSDYARTKAHGEERVLSHVPTATILRPSIVFGAEDEFFNRFAGMSRMGPVLPIVGGTTQFQPVYVDDVAHAAQKALAGEAAPGIYELGGPQIASFRELMTMMLGIVHRRRLVVDIPMFAAGIIASGLELAQTMTLGLVRAQITRDQVKNLARNNIVAQQAYGFCDLEIVPRDMASVLPDYLWRFRPSGQYDAIKESANNLKNM